ncbi:hypothetical protein QFC19_000607 [Naganishia cerealis]|uniref:Uncharacterized protein n=1 Tax=Naganishia cerealis TaxID=610337 RepID=A0ACC2WM88_9TREE|nr:hypothetical protein QFC19_000607 [Naganishia cerealis]
MDEYAAASDGYVTIHSKRHPFESFSSNEIKDRIYFSDDSDLESIVDNSVDEESSRDAEKDEDSDMERVLKPDDDSQADKSSSSE